MKYLGVLFIVLLAACNNSVQVGDCIDATSEGHHIPLKVATIFPNGDLLVSNPKGRYWTIINTKDLEDLKVSCWYYDILVSANNRRSNKDE